MTAPSGQATANIREASYYQEYQANVVKHRWFMVGEPARKPNPTAQKVQINILYDAYAQPPSHSRSLNRLLFHFLWSFTCFYRLSHSESVDIEKVAVCSSLRSLKSKLTIESRAKRSSKIISLGHYSILLASSYTVKSFNSLVHSIHALSALRRSGLRTASTTANPCQGDSSEFYLITGSVYTDQRGTVVFATLFNESEQRCFHQFITNIKLQESRRLQLLTKERSHGDRESTTGGCQFLSRRLISWQCKKQIVVATSSTEAEYVADASCCGQELVRSRLQLADDGGVTDLPISEIYSGMDTLGYVTEGKLTFFKKKNSPQWRFLVHTLLHCLSPKSGIWDQFGSPIDIALICLSDGRRFNWSNYNFRGMVNNIGNAKKFLMYPRFLQTILGIETRVTKQYKVLVFSSKLFANMRLNFTGNPMPLLPTMLLQAAAGGGAEVAAQDVPHPVPAPDQSIPQLTNPSRPPSPDPVAYVLEHDHSYAQPKTAAGSIPSTKDAHMGTDFYTSPLRSSHTPPVDHRSGGVEDPIILTALSSVVSTLTKKRKMVVSDSDEEEGTTPNVNLEALPATGTTGVANGTTGVAAGATEVVASASRVGAGPSKVALGDSTGSPGGSVTPTADSAISADSPQVPPGASNRGKSPMIEEDILVPSKTLRQMEEDRLGDDVSEDNFPARMAALIKKKRQALAEQSFKERQNRPLTPAQQKAYMRQRTSHQKPKSPEEPIPSMPEIPIPPVVTSPPSSRTQRKSIACKPMIKPKSTLPTLDLDATAQTFLKVIVDEDSDDEEYVDEVWSAVVGWELISTPLGEVN
nr:ribonuclease H-like domain, reverse transcriptase, RNA-dependent DNA polymerase [Tanacetum cinerariifolium]